MKRYLNSIEKMRKYLMAIAAVICCTMAASMLTACGSDDDDSSSSNGPATTEEKEEKKVATVDVDLTIAQTKDFLKYFDMTVECSNGTNPITMTKNDTTWTGKVSVNVPGKITIKETVTQKDGVDLSAETTEKIYVYHPQNGCSYKSTLKDATGAFIKSGDSKLLGKFNQPKLSTLAQQVSDRKYNKTITITVDDKGNITDSTN